MAESTLRTRVVGNVLTRTLVERGERLAAVPRRRGALAEAAWDALTAAHGPGAVERRWVAVLDGSPVSMTDLGGVEPAGDHNLLLAPAPDGIDPVTAVLLAIAVASTAASAALALTVRTPRLAGSDEAPHRRFGFNRVSADAFAGGDIPVVLGERKRYGGHVIAKVPGEGAGGEGDARLKILICLGHGPVQSIGNQTADFDRVAASSLSGIYLNEQPISSFPGCVVSGRLGSAGQSVIPGFGDVETLREVGVGGVALRNTSGSDRTGAGASAEAYLFTTVGPVNAVVPRVRFGSGLYSLSDKGQVNPQKVQWRVRWRLTAGPGAWSAWTVVTVDRAEQSEFSSAPRLDNLVAGAGAQVDVQAERVTAEPTTASAVDAMVWDQCVEVIYASQTYANLAVLALDLQASEQLAGVPTVSASVKGLKVRVWDGVSSPSAPVFVTQFSANPAYLALALLTDSTWGMGAAYQDAAVDMPSLIDWAQVCDQDVARVSGGGTRKRYRYNFVLDQKRDGVDWLRAICRAGRCSAVCAGNIWKFIPERAQSSAVETFTDGSVAAGDDGSGPADIEYRREWTTGGAVRPNRVVAQFENELADGQPDVLKYPGDGALWLATETVHETQGSFEGQTDPEQVAAQAIYMMNQIRSLAVSVTLMTSRPVVVVQPGERFDLATSLPGWGLASGRLLAGCTGTALKLDRTVTLEGGKSYVARVLHPDGSVEDRAVVSGAGTYAPGDLVVVNPALAQSPAEFAEYTLGESGKHVKPFLCTRVALRDPENLVWEVDGVEYVEGIYSDTPGVVDLPGYSSLVSPFTPPGPVTNLVAFERLTNDIRIVELAWGQTLKDAENTATFRIFRRIVGAATWVLVPTPTVARRGAVIELADVDRAYEFCVVAVSPSGAALSPYDPSVPRTNIVYGLSSPPPGPPTSPALTWVGGNTYTLSWTAPVSNPPDTPAAVGYQVLFGGDATSLPNGGAEDCLVLARTTDPSLAGLELPPGRSCTFWIRSVGANGRLSWSAAVATIAAPVTPPGKSIKQTRVFALSSEGTLANLTWNSGTARLELTNPAADGVWTGPEVDTGSVSLCEVTFRPETANDADDVAINVISLFVPSIEADQWGIIATGPKFVGMLMPPYPDAQQAWVFEVRTNDGTVWSDWSALAPGASMERALRKYQVRVTMRRAKVPYRPALRGLTAVLTH